MKNFSIYVHVPFCVSKCAYCDFYSLPCGESGQTNKKTAYINAVLRNMETWGERANRRCADSIFIGGGTPTSLDTSQISDLICGIKKNFNITPNAEFTVEANPKTFDEDKLLTLRKLGVNRLSIGMQSANDSELRAISRIHTFSEAKDAFELARKCGFDNINLDLMYGLPSQTAESFTKTLDAAANLHPEHISVYGLQLEEGTPLWRQRDSLTFPTEDEVNGMNAHAQKKLGEHGYFRYEISNYSLPGKECAHNLGYWSQKEYLGFGPGAYSFWDAKRFGFPEDLDTYCTCLNFDALCVTDEILSKEEINREFVMLSLRLTRGVELSALSERTLNAENLLSLSESFIKSGHMSFENGFLRFTPSGFNISNYILSELLF